MSVPPGTEMFQFPGFASRTYVFSTGYPSQGGFPHSDIRGSQVARTSPRLLAACHVLHRLLTPRHPPNALVIPRITPAPPAHRTKPHPSRERPPAHASSAPAHTPTYTHAPDNHPNPDREFSPHIQTRTAIQTNPMHSLKEHATPGHSTRHRWANPPREAETAQTKPAPHPPAIWRLAGSNR
jgi:hypothetical protein